jgi:glycosyltransferase involved in cell wall biosynthesis
MTHDILASAPDERERLTVTFVVPCLNERDNIASTISAVETALTGAAISSYEIVIVDDCSIDGTGKFVAELAQNNPRLRLISNRVNLGFGGAYKAGLQHARGTFVIVVPGDNAYPPEGIERILRKAGSADIVVPYFADRRTRHLNRRILSRAFTYLLNGLFNLHVPYFNGPVLHRAALLHAIDIKTDGFAFQAECIIKLIKAGATFTTVPVEVVERTAGRSSAFKLRNIYLVVATLPRLWLEVRHPNRAIQVAVSKSRIQAIASNHSSP